MASPLFAQGSFINDANLTPEQIARKRELIASLMPRFGDAKYVGEGLGQLLYGIGMGRAQKRLDQAETEGRAKADDIFSRVIANPQGNGGFSILGTTPASMPAPQNMPTGPVKIDNTPTTYDPKAPWAIGMDTMTALGKTPSADHLAKGLEARGFTQPAAQGAVMAMNDESGLNPSVNEVSPLVPGSRGGFGLNQWTGPRRVALEKFAADTGRDVRDPQVQLDFMAQEMAGPEASAGRSVMSAATPQDAAIKMTTDYLRPADPTARVAKYGGQPQIPTDMLYSALSNPWLSPDQKSVIASLIQKQTDAADPMKALELQRAQLELDAMQHPKPGYATLSPQEVQKLGLPAGVWQKGPDGQISAVSSGGAGGTEYGLNPIYGTDAQGNQVVLQLGKDGTAVPTKLPEGVKPDLTAKAEGNAAGKVQGEASANLGAAKIGADMMLQQIDGLLNFKGLDSMVGPIQGHLPNVSASANEFQARLDQIKGSAFMQAYQTLRGGGQITEVEGQKATDAMARLNTAQDEATFRQALLDLKGVVQAGLSRVQAQTGHAGQAAPQAAPIVHTFDPATGGWK